MEELVSRYQEALRWNDQQKFQESREVCTDILRQLDEQSSNLDESDKVNRLAFLCLKYLGTVATAGTSAEWRARVLSRAATLDPTDAATWFALAEAAVEAGDLVLARIGLEHSLARSPRFTAARDLLLQVHARSGHVREGLAVARAILQSEPDHSLAADLMTHWLQLEPYHMRPHELRYLSRPATSSVPLPQILCENPAEDAPAEPDSRICERFWHRFVHGQLRPRHVWSLEPEAGEAEDSEDAEGCLLQPLKLAGLRWVDLVRALGQFVKQAGDPQLNKDLSLTKPLRFDLPDTVLRRIEQLQQPLSSSEDEEPSQPEEIIEDAALVDEKTPEAEAAEDEEPGEGTESIADPPNSGVSLRLRRQRATPTPGDVETQANEDDGGEDGEDSDSASVLDGPIDGDETEDGSVQETLQAMRRLLSQAYDCSPDQWKAEEMAAKSSRQWASAPLTPPIVQPPPPSSIESSTPSNFVVGDSQTVSQQDRWDESLWLWTHVVQVNPPMSVYGLCKQLWTWLLPDRCSGGVPEIQWSGKLAEVARDLAVGLERLGIVAQYPWDVQQRIAELVFGLVQPYDRIQRSARQYGSHRDGPLSAALLLRVFGAPPLRPDSPRMGVLRARIYEWRGDLAMAQRILSLWLSSADSPDEWIAHANGGQGEWLNRAAVQAISLRLSVAASLAALERLSREARWDECVNEAVALLLGPSSSSPRPYDRLMSELVSSGPLHERLAVGLTAEVVEKVVGVLIRHVLKSGQIEPRLATALQAWILRTGFLADPKGLLSGMDPRESPPAQSFLSACDDPLQFRPVAAAWMEWLAAQLSGMSVRIKTKRLLEPPVAVALMALETIMADLVRRHSDASTGRTEWLAALHDLLGRFGLCHTFSCIPLELLALLRAEHFPAIQAGRMQEALRWEDELSDSSESLEQSQSEESQESSFCKDPNVDPNVDSSDLKKGAKSPAPSVYIQDDKVVGNSPMELEEENEENEMEEEEEKEEENSTPDQEEEIEEDKEEERKERRERGLWREYAGCIRCLMGPVISTRIKGHHKRLGRPKRAAFPADVQSGAELTAELFGLLPSLRSCRERLGMDELAHFLRALVAQYPLQEHMPAARAFWDSLRGRLDAEQPVDVVEIVRAAAAEASEDGSPLRSMYVAAYGRLLDMLGRENDESRPILEARLTVWPGDAARWARLAQKSQDEYRGLLEAAWRAPGLLPDADAWVDALHPEARLRARTPRLAQIALALCDDSSSSSVAEAMHLLLFEYYRLRTRYSRAEVYCAPVDGAPGHLLGYMAEESRITLRDAQARMAAAVTTDRRAEWRPSLLLGKLTLRLGGDLNDGWAAVEEAARRFQQSGAAGVDADYVKALLWYTPHAAMLRLLADHPSSEATVERHREPFLRTLQTLRGFFMVSSPPAVPPEEEEKEKNEEPGEMEDDGSPLFTPSNQLFEEEGMDAVQEQGHAAKDEDRLDKETVVTAVDSTAPLWEVCLRSMEMCESLSVRFFAHGYAMASILAAGGRLEAAQLVLDDLDPGQRKRARTPFSAYWQREPGKYIQLVRRHYRLAMALAEARADRERLLRMTSNVENKDTSRDLQMLLYAAQCRVLALHSDRLLLAPPNEERSLEQKSLASLVVSQWARGQRLRLATYTPAPMGPRIGAACCQPNLVLLLRQCAETPMHWPQTYARLKAPEPLDMAGLEADAKASAEDMVRVAVRALADVDEPTALTLKSEEALRRLRRRAGGGPTSSSSSAAKKPRRV